MVRVDWKMDGAKYREILEKKKPVGVAKDLRLRQKFIFQQDNDVEYKARATME